MVGDFKDESLDFVYIDGNHGLKNVVHDIVEWSQKVRKGGIVSGHDYRNPQNNRSYHVVQAVNAYMVAYKIMPWFILGSKRVLKGEVRDGARSWMFVKGE